MVRLAQLPASPFRRRLVREAVGLLRAVRDLGAEGSQVDQVQVGPVDPADRVVLVRAVDPEPVGASARVRAVVLEAEAAPEVSVGDQVAAQVAAQVVAPEVQVEAREDAVDPAWVVAVPTSAAHAVVAAISKSSSRPNSPPIRRQPHRCPTLRSLLSADLRHVISVPN